MAGVTVEEKRLRQLKQQLFGKEQPLLSQTPKYKSQDTNKFQFAKESLNLKGTNTQTAAVNPISLKTDFTKIISFSFLALSIQLALYFLSKQGLINLFN